MKLPTKILEKRLFTLGYKYIIAVDEVGVGPLAGPVAACAVLITKKFLAKRNKKLFGVRDSKLLSAKQREEFAEELRNNKDIRFAVAYVRPGTIDRINIYQAARKAMRRAISKLVIHKATRSYSYRVLKLYSSTAIVLVDGKAKIDGLNIEQRAIVKGDRKVFSIACASIIAKVARDKMMARYSKKFPKSALK